MAFDIPLFPLNTVLFPEIPLQLHIFEERYKHMISECLDTREPFGVVLIKKGVESSGSLAEPYLIGCTADIVTVERLSEGRMNITAVGGERFRVLSLSRDREYLVGRVEKLPIGIEDPAAIEREVSRLRPRVSEYLQMLADAGNIDFDPAQLPKQPLSLSYLAAYLLQIPQSQKQDLLASEDAAQMMAQTFQLYVREIALLDAMLDQQQGDGIGSFSPN